MTPAGQLVAVLAGARVVTSRTCPYCHREPGKPCRRRAGRAYVHQVRVMDTGEQLALGPLEQRNTRPSSGRNTPLEELDPRLRHAPFNPTTGRHHP
jgi:hypothetical protein